MIRAATDANTRIVGAIVASALLHVIFVALNYSGGSSGAAIAAAPDGRLFEKSLKVRIGAAQELPTPVTNVVVAAPAVAPAAPPAIAPVADVGIPDSANRIADDGEASAPRSGSQWSPFEGSSYHASSALDKRPQALGDISIEPRELRSVVASGRLIMTLWISPGGEVERATVDESELPPMFAESSVEAFRRLRFTPGELNGKNVGAIMKIEVTYEDPREPRVPQTQPSAASADP